MGKLLRVFENVDHQTGATRLVKVVDTLPDYEWDEEWPIRRKWVKWLFLGEEVYFDPNLAFATEIQAAARMVRAGTAIRRTGIIDLAAFAPSTNKEVLAIGAYTKLLVEKYTLLALTPYTYPYYLVAIDGVREAALSTFEEIKELEESGKRIEAFELYHLMPRDEAFYAAGIIGVWGRHGEVE